MTIIMNCMQIPIDTDKPHLEDCPKVNMEDK